VSEREPIRFYFSVAPLASAFMRHADGGGRLKIDVDQSGVAAINELLDIAVRQRGVLFAAVVLSLEVEEAEEQPKSGLGKWHRE
jgi:hypothetical protein